MSWCKGVIHTPDGDEHAIDVILSLGSACSYLSKATAEKFGLTIVEKKKPRNIVLVTGNDQSTVTHEAWITLTLKTLTQTVTVDLMPFETNWLCLGAPWFRENKAMFDRDGVSVKDENGELHNVSEKDSYPLLIAPAIFYTN